MPNSRSVTSNQSTTHENLVDIVKKHLRTTFQRPIPERSKKSFEQLTDNRDLHNAIIDSGCGNARSSISIAQMNPNTLVIGIDKSNARLSKRSHDNIPNNLILLREDLIDLYQLAAQHNIKLSKHYILYPNPWPKKRHLQRRWHGSPVLPSIITLGGALEVRSNWETYIDEMVIALSVAGINANKSTIQIIDEQYLTDFEAKYHKSDQPLFKLTADLNR